VALFGGEWVASRPGRFALGERACCAHWVGGWVGPSTDLDDTEKRNLLALPGLELQPLYHLAYTQSLYRLSYPDNLYKIIVFVYFEGLKLVMELTVSYRSRVCVTFVQ
jgi:hypothetical protein